MEQSNKWKHDVFISYSHMNKNVADAIVSDFENNGIKCWYAPRDILPGEEWVSAITGALSTARVLVLIYTGESNNSRQVMNEIAVAFNAGLTIVPFRLSQEQMSSELEYYLTRVHWLDALTKPLKQNIASLREYINVILSAKDPAQPSENETDDNGKTSKEVISSSAVNSSEVNSSSKAKKSKKKIPIIIASVAAAVILIIVPIIVYSTSSVRAYQRHSFKTLGDRYYDGDGVEMDEEKAKEYYLKAVAYSPEKGGKIHIDKKSTDEENAAMLNRIGLILFREGDYENAAVFFSESAKIKEDATVMVNSSMSYLYQEDYENASDWYDKAVDAGYTGSDSYMENVLDE